MRTTSNVVGQGRAMVLSTAPVIEKYYQDDEAKKEALTRHASEYINTNQTMYGLLAGIACAMEKGCIFSEPAKLLNFLTTDGSKDTGF